MRRFHICNPLVVGILGLLLSVAVLGAGEAPSSAGATSGEAEELWYVLELDGRQAGWAVERRWEEGGRRVTEAETVLRVARGGAPLRVSLAGRFVETAGGEPLSLSIRRSLGAEPVETTYRYAGDRVETETVQAGRTRRETLPAPEGEWLTPAEAREAVRRRHRAGRSAYRLRAVDPLEGLEPVTLTRSRLGEAAAAPEAAGRWREELSSIPGAPSIVELDADGELVWSRTELLGLEATLRRSDRETALAGADGGDPGAPRGSGVPEVLLTTLVRPDRPIPEPARSRRGVYELSLTPRSPGEAGHGTWVSAPGDYGPAPRPELPDLPAEGAQRVERRGDRLRVTVTVPGPAPGPALGEAPPPPPPARRRQPDADRPGPAWEGPAADPRDPALLADTPYLDHRDPEIRRLLERALASDRQPDRDPGHAPHGSQVRAETPDRLTRFVHSWVARKDLGTGFATASEVARARSGDCTEHAVLLAALLRAAGVPSRVVSGLVYLEDFAGAEGIFGYHLWVQAWTGGRWLDLDPTLPGGFDATHIALGVSNLAGPEAGRDLDVLLALMGKLRIHVVGVEP